MTKASPRTDSTGHQGKRADFCHKGSSSMCGKASGGCICCLGDRDRPWEDLDTHSVSALHWSGWGPPLGGHIARVRPQHSWPHAPVCLLGHRTRMSLCLRSLHPQFLCDQRTPSLGFQGHYSHPGPQSPALPTTLQSPCVEVFPLLLFGEWCSVLFWV